MNVGGELELHRGGGRPASYLPAMGTLQLDPSASPTLAERRGDAAGSLNFRLAEADVAAGPLTLRVGRVTDAMAGRRLALVSRPGVQATVTVEFVESPPLRLRVIGMRYTGRDGLHRSPGRSTSRCSCRGSGGPSPWPASRPPRSSPTSPTRRRSPAAR